MAGVHLGAALGQIHRLFDEGTLAGLPDARLLERYASERDELAFETLVKRHGRMVMAACRGIVDDPNDADDAFQAAFLLLARKAVGCGSMIPWGAGFIAWLAASPLQSEIRRCSRRDVERGDAASDRAGGISRRSPPPTFIPCCTRKLTAFRSDIRKPIVLCYLEEMTYQQAASPSRG